MGNLTANTFTKQVTSSSFTIVEAYGLTAVSVFCTSGTVTILGNWNIGALSSEPITLSSNQGINLMNSGNSKAILDGIVIDATSGSVALVGS